MDNSQISLTDVADEEVIKWIAIILRCAPFLFSCFIWLNKITTAAETATRGNRANHQGDSFFGFSWAEVHCSHLLAIGGRFRANFWELWGQSKVIPKRNWNDFSNISLTCFCSIEDRSRSHLRHFLSIFEKSGIPACNVGWERVGGSGCMSNDMRYVEEWCVFL